MRMIRVRRSAEEYAQHAEGGRGVERCLWPAAGISGPGIVHVSDGIGEV